MVGRHPLEDERLRLPGLDREARADAARVALERAARPAHHARDPALQGERERRGAEQHAVRVQLDLVLLAPVVEARLDGQLELHRPAHDHDAPQQPVTVHVGLRLDRHEVLHLAHAAVGVEARDEDVRVREVELLGGPVVAGRPERVEAAAVLVEDRAEHARGVEPRAAVPVDRAVRADERDRVEVAHEPVLGDREVRALVPAGVSHRSGAAHPAQRPAPLVLVLLRRHRRGAEHARARAVAGEPDPRVDARAPAPCGGARCAPRARAAGRRRATRRRRSRSRRDRTC